MLIIPDILRIGKVPDGYVREVDIESIIRGEYDENVMRKEFTPGEAWHLGEAMKEHIKAEAKKRQSEAGEKVGQKNMEKFHKEAGHQLACANLAQAKGPTQNPDKSSSYEDEKPKRDRFSEGPDDEAGR